MKTANKTKTVIAILLILVMSPSTMLQAKPIKKEIPKSSCLEISGRIAKSVKVKNKVGVVQLIENNVVVETKKIGSHETFKFVLKSNKQYAIKVTYEGFVERLVCISTHIPQNLNDTTIHKFHFDLFPPVKDAVSSEQADVLDFPVALIHYNSTKSCFDFNLKYTENIKNHYFNFDNNKGNSQKVPQKLAYSLPKL